MFPSHDAGEDKGDKVQFSGVTAMIMGKNKSPMVETIIRTKKILFPVVDKFVTTYQISSSRDNYNKFNEV